MRRAYFRLAEYLLGSIGRRLSAAIIYRAFGICYRESVVSRGVRKIFVVGGRDLEALYTRRLIVRWFLGGAMFIVVEK